MFGTTTRVGDADVETVAVEVSAAKQQRIKSALC